MRILSHALSASLLSILVLSGCAKDSSDDGGDDTSTLSVVDDDGDGVPAEEDCDDANAELGAIAEDADCDGVLTAGDCDDADASSTVVAEDADCDGVLTADDCDDANPNSHIDLDGDGSTICDGDCDDSDASLDAADSDNDGYSTCDGDCDDSDASLELDDFDSDGFTTCDGDCDDNDASLDLADLDGDGYSTCDGDCDDSDSESTTGAEDADGDGYSTCDGDCDDQDSSQNPGGTDTLLDDLDCDGTTKGTLDLSDYQFVGELKGDVASRVSSAGDVDGDGFDDLLIGATGDDTNGNAAGAAYIVLASSLGSSRRIDLSKADYKLLGWESYDNAGTVSSAGDVDGDGLDDLLIGAHGGDDNNGVAYIVLGSSLGTKGWIHLNYDADYEFVGEDGSGSNAGYSVSSAGDVDGDGLDDVLVGAPQGGVAYAGAAYIVLGSSLGTSSTIDLSNADYKFSAEQEDYVGQSVSSAGDVDGDGLDDVLVGVYGDDDGGTDAGAAYIVLGSSLGTSSTIDLSNADYKLVGETSDDFAGIRVSSAGDVDGDGLDDVLVGSYKNDDGGTNAGAAWVVLGSSLSTSSISLSKADYKLVGEVDKDYAGYSLASAGDLDGDGLADIVIGAMYNDEGGTDAGAAYIVLSSSLGTGGTIDLSDADHKFMGEADSDYVGSSVSSAGDVDGDGRDDLMVGASGNDRGGSSAGAVYLVLTGP